VLPERNSLAVKTLTTASGIAETALVTNQGSRADSCEIRKCTSLSTCPAGGDTLQRPLNIIMSASLDFLSGIHATLVRVTYAGLDYVTYEELWATTHGDLPAL
jgi:hypothetical protein